MESGERKFWFALQVKPKHENSSAAALRNQGYEEFVPLYRSRRRWSDRVKELELPLFAGYVFCRFDPSKRLPVVTTPGVHAIVGIGRRPAPINDSEIEALQAVVNSRLKVEPWPFLEVGRRVRIDSGPLGGVEGILVDIKDRQRLVVSVNLLQRSVAVEVDSGWVSAVRD